MPVQEGLDAIRAWVRMDRAFAQFNRWLETEHGITGAQLGVLRIIAEMQPVTLAELRSRLTLHPATLGQLVDRIAARGLVVRGPCATDHRRREVALSALGLRTLERAPLAGPVRLRTATEPPARLKALADALTDAVSLFGLEEWAR
jgi:DNA-binding MarR family transcriptional regulator